MAEIHKRKPLSKYLPKQSPELLLRKIFWQHRPNSQTPSWHIAKRAQSELDNEKLLRGVIRSYTRAYTETLQRLTEAPYDIAIKIAAARVLRDRNREIEGLNSAFSKLLRTLKPSEEKVIRERYGIDAEARTQVEIARLENCSRTKIYSIEKMAIRKLKHPSRAVLLRRFASALNLLYRDPEET